VTLRRAGCMLWLRAAGSSSFCSLPVGVCPLTYGGGLAGELLPATLTWPKFNTPRKTFF
jgi:hypothetical protein